ncbi:MAG TPA: dockerin type I domain-containing protein [Candidatus Polarisedimenticolia bacterium]|nr:dockerin type I domain-containing protein [Candidatus Polarisedimenticolia bacterium]
MPGSVVTDRLKRLLGVAFIVLLANLAPPAPAIAATLRVSWASGVEADIAGYRLRYGTAPGQYFRTFDAGLVNSCELNDLDRDQRYYISVYAYDTAGNESLPSPEVTAQVPGSMAPVPSLDAAFENSTRSIYALRGRSNVFVLYGTGFAPGADVDFGAGISAGTAVLNAQGNLQLLAQVTSGAAMGPHTVVVSNPDGGVGSRSDTLTVIRTPDINADCRVDVVDLNALARAWNEASGESSYTSASDLDGDGYVGPEDLSIFVQYYLRTFTGCP